MAGSCLIDQHLFGSLFGTVSGFAEGLSVPASVCSFRLTALAQTNFGVSPFLPAKITCRKLETSLPTFPIPFLKPNRPSR